MVNKMIWNIFEVRGGDVTLRLLGMYKYLKGNLNSLGCSKVMIKPFFNF